MLEIRSPGRQPNPRFANRQPAAEQIRQRVGALELADDPRHAVEQLLSELLPLDDDRRQDVRQS
jgi:hypothetical protein